MLSCCRTHSQSAPLRIGYTQRRTRSPTRSSRTPRTSPPYCPTCSRTEAVASGPRRLMLPTLTCYRTGTSIARLPASLLELHTHRERGTFSCPRCSLAYPCANWVVRAYTDHNPLLFVANGQSQSEAPSLELQQYNFNVVTGRARITCWLTCSAEVAPGNKCYCVLLV